MNTMTKKVPAETLRLMALPFFEAGAVRAFVALCCDRVFVGAAPAERCAHCKGVPTNIEVSSASQAAELGSK